MREGTMDKDFSYGILMANRQIKLDVDPQRDDDASPMSSYRCLLRPT